MTTTRPAAASDITGRNVRALRKMNGWTMADLAQHAGLSANVIENIETGRRSHDGRRRRDITVDELLALSRAFKATPSSLLPDLDDAGGDAIPEIAANEDFAAAFLAVSDRPEIEEALRRVVLSVLRRLD